MTLFLNQNEWSEINSYVDNESLHQPKINIDQKNKRGHLKWTPPAAKDIKTIIDMIDTELSELAPIVGLTAKTIESYQECNSKYNIKYASYARLCKLAALKKLGKSLPKPGGWIFEKSDREILTTYLPEACLRYPVLAELYSKDTNGSINWQFRPEPKDVSNIIDALSDHGYKNQDIMGIIGITARAVRAKKTHEKIELQQLIPLCETLLQAESGNTEYGKPIRVNNQDQYIDNNGHILPDDWYD